MASDGWRQIVGYFRGHGWLHRIWRGAATPACRRADTERSQRRLYLFVKPGLVADLHIVAVGIEHIGRVIAGIELLPQPWRAIILAAIGKRCLVGLVRRRLVLRGERDVKLGAGGLCQSP